MNRQLTTVQVEEKIQESKVVQVKRKSQGSISFQIHSIKNQKFTTGHIKRKIPDFARVQIQCIQSLESRTVWVEGKTQNPTSFHTTTTQDRDKAAPNNRKREEFANPQIQRRVSQLSTAALVEIEILKQRILIQIQSFEFRR